MHLKELKLAGFKSFVDPTRLSFPSQLVAIVGPNGCGKSNIIDAVRWVLGESSAKNLRGEAMTDIIFNGSSHRKALGQASIELVFDNSLGRLTGQYASYQEIALKRLVTRDGESCYFLNGSRCRRRDITDIFLGTGAGARGYSIISQGTVSRIIEAKPEELRAYLEEAAGISKYKERRRETLSRLEHTRENLARVADIHHELDKQLQRLECQAKAAEHYKQLKAEERLSKIEILALKWRALREAQQKSQTKLQRFLLDYERHQAKATEAQRQGLLLREKLAEDNASFQQIQAGFYQLATEIARLEEGVQQHQREKQRLKAYQQQLQSDEQRVSSQLRQDQETLAVSEALWVELQGKLEGLQGAYHLKRQLVQQKQEEQTSWASKMQALQLLLNKASSETQVEALRLQHLSERRQQILADLEKNKRVLDLMGAEDLAANLAGNRIQQQSLEAKLQLAEESYQQGFASVTLLRQQLVETEKLLHQAQSKAYRLHTQQAGLEAAQQTALAGTAGEQPQLAPWVDRPRLVETVEVEKNWQLACEFVLAEGLEAIVLDSLASLWPRLQTLQGCSALFTTLSETGENKAVYPRLSDKIKGLKPSWTACLDKIYTASSLHEAIACLANLSADESVITEEGYWLAKGWVKIAGADRQKEVSLIARQEELATIKEAVSMAEQELSILEEQRDDCYGQVKDNEEALEFAKQNLSASRDALRACETELNHQEQLLRQSETRKKALADESQLLLASLQDIANQQEAAGQLLTSASRELKKYEQEQNQLLLQKASFEGALQENQLALDEAQTALHQGQLEASREKLKTQQLQVNLQREQQHLETLNARLAALTSCLVELENPELVFQQSLALKTLQHSELKEELTQHQDQLRQSARQLESWESLVKSEEKLAKTVREKVQQEQMEEQATALRASAVQEALAELDALQVETLIASLPADANLALVEQKLENIIIKINGLGPINLAAIGEYDCELQRKQHLEAQQQDLTEALATLEAAIKKIDRETEQRLQTIFEEVNTAFQALFPRLFGGGRAMLESTCDNLLEAGILVMAQPPGKRNSTIHLLSGGEKALTAIALVFAIFQLNPSPFCMLDEVDAPLDDVNVGRFCDLVKEMSQFVQFLLITHNKITMELAAHLIGVTMREPGVSRVVAVDVEEALAMAE